MRQLLLALVLAAALALPLAGCTSPTSSTVEQATPSSTVAAQKTVAIVGWDWKTTEKNDIWWKLSWKVEIENSGDRSEEIDAEIDYLDADDFVLQTDWEWNMVVPAGQTKSFSGYSLVDTGIAPQVDSATIRIRW